MVHYSLGFGRASAARPWTRIQLFTSLNVTCGNQIDPMSGALRDKTTSASCHIHDSLPLTIHNI